MKIDFIISDLLGGGAQRVMVILANHFAKKGYDISIITFGGEKDEFEINPLIKRIKLHKSKIKIRRIGALVNLLKYYKAKKNRPAIIISFITLMNLISIIVAKVYSIKIIISEHNSHLQAQRPKLLTHATRKLFYRHADFVTVLTSYDIDFYKKLKSNVVVMPNPCSFMPVEKSKKQREKVILAAGNLDRYHHKGFDNLISLIEPILKSNPDWILKIIGGGDTGKSYLKNIAENSDITKQVVFAGFQSNVAEIMNNSEIFILSSRYEGLPMVLLEAMSQGMACIAYDCKTGPSDIITNEVNGLLIEDQNIPSMQNGLKKLISDELLRDKLKANAIKSLDNYSIKSIEERWEKLFNELLPDRK